MKPMASARCTRVGTFRFFGEKNGWIFGQSMGKPWLGIFQFTDSDGNTEAGRVGD